MPDKFKLKNVISVLLCFILVTASIPWIYAEEAVSADVLASEETEYENNRELLECLNVISESDLAEAEASVSRSEFIVYVSRLMKIPEVPAVNANYFADILPGSRNANLINFFAECGYISVGEDRLFRPNDIIRSEEAYKIFLEILGYGIVANENGAFPAGYMKIAGRLDMSVLAMGEQIDEQTLVNLLAEFAAVPFYDITSIQEDGLREYAVNETLTILSVYHGINIAEGYVDGISGSCFNGSPVHSNKMLADGEYYDISYLQYPDDFLGRHVKIYYSEENGSDRTAIYVIYSQKDSKTRVIDARQFIEFSSDYTLTYYKDTDSDIQYSAKIDRGVSVICNGELQESDITKLFDDFNYGSVCLSDRDGDDRYDHMVIKKYKNIFVGFCDKDASTFYDEISGKVYDLSDFGYVNIYSSNYQRADFAAIETKCVLSVATMGDNWIEIIISNTFATEKVDEKISGSSLRDTDMIRVGEEIYYIFEELDPATMTAYKTVESRPGSTYRFYFNVFGDIVYSEAVSEGDEMKTGYLIDCSEEKSIGSVVSFRLMEEDGEIYTYRLTEDVSLDGKKADNSAVAGAVRDADNTIIPQVIQYTLDEDNCISKIDTANVGDNESIEDSLTMFEDSADASWTLFSMGTTAKKRFGIKTLVDTSTKIFIVPRSSVIKNHDYDEDMFEVYTPQDFIVDRTESYTAYKTNAYHGYCDVVVCYRDAASSYSDAQNIMIVDEVQDRLDDDGNVVKTVCGMYGGVDAAIYVSNSYDVSKALPKSGDVIVFSTNLVGELVDYVLVYDYANDYKPTEPLFDSVQWNGYQCSSSTSSTLSQRFLCTLTYPAFKDGSTVSLAPEKSMDFLAQISDAIDLSSYTIMVYDASVRTGQPKTYAGTVDDIKDIKSCGPDDCSSMLIHYRYSAVKDIILFK